MRRLLSSQVVHKYMHSNCQLEVSLASHFRIVLRKKRGELGVASHFRIVPRKKKGRIGGRWECIAMALGSNGLYENPVASWVLGRLLDLVHTSLLGISPPASAGQGPNGFPMSKWAYVQLIRFGLITLISGDFRSFHTYKICMESLKIACIRETTQT